ncbi:hypothetical protein SteCoe_13673 [Stentor coeruleus]|uniref:EF-hand domain-containing protein n=1 Tax=Stentor coeruleus TaxID=5963 RepID=A0A1R2C7V8_9CILI|nr:hypothetical protein SteCoe_13673 [Stentor coeruleus]
MSRKSLYLSAASFKGKTRGKSRGKTPDKRLIEDDYDINDNDISLMKEAFYILDINDAGVINKRDFISVLELMKEDCIIGQRMLQDLSSLEEDITIDIFIRHLQKKRGNKTSKEGIQSVFNLIDNGEGKVTLESLKEMCKEIGESIPDEQIRDALDKLSPDTKCITEDEFMVLMKPNKSR